MAMTSRERSERWRRKMGMQPRELQRQQQAARQKPEAERKAAWRRIKTANLKKLYGITMDDYDRMFEVQGGCCAICGIHQSEVKSPFHVDHCHQTGTIRGLLCQNCNKALGFLGDSREVLERAIAYLNRFMS